MKMPLRLLSFLSTVLLITSCANKGHVVAITHETYPAKNPLQVSLYDNNQSPHTAYRIIGIATVSKYNLLGTERQNATLNTMLKKLAASIGGDGLINVKTNEESMQGHVIAFEKILI